MGRRDEPELDELSRLLRRLETMEVCAQARECPRSRSRKPRKPQAEYVGALRGAAAGQEFRRRSGSAYEARPYRALDCPAVTREASSSSTSAIVIGAGDGRRWCRRSWRPDWCCGRGVGQQGEGDTPTDLLCRRRAHPAELQRPDRRRWPRRSAGRSRPRRRRTLRRCCSAPTSTCAAASPARRASSLEQAAQARLGRRRADARRHVRSGPGHPIQQSRG